MKETRIFNGTGCSRKGNKLYPMTQEEGNQNINYVNVKRVGTLVPSDRRLTDSRAGYEQRNSVANSN